MISNYRDIHVPELGLIFQLCLYFMDSSVPMINNSSSVTLRQVVVFIFERMERPVEPGEKGKGRAKGDPVHRTRGIPLG